MKKKYDKMMLNESANKVFSAEKLGDEGYKNAYNKFGYEFCNAVTASSNVNANICVSPLSAYMAFSLCFAGSGGKTAEEFEKVFGLDKENAKEFCGALYAGFIQREYRNDQTKVNLANSVWVDGKSAQYVKEEYLKTATESFDAPVFNRDFSDPKTVNAINDWCSEQTNGLIKKIIDNLSPNDFLAIINALSIEASWVEQYKKYEKTQGEFTNADGTKNEAEYLNRKISYFYEAKDAVAFAMPLKDGFSFVGILPNEGEDNYLNELTAEKIQSLLKNPNYDYNVYTRIPKFSMDCDYDLRLIMKNMGLVTAFESETADFKGLAELPNGNVYIGTAKQKTHFELDENGIKAAAITFLGMKSNSAYRPVRPDKNIFLERPFAYLIQDDVTGLPLFVGTVKKLK